jgi:hypothetical protein
MLKPAQLLAMQAFDVAAERAAIDELSSPHPKAGSRRFRT